MYRIALLALENCLLSSVAGPLDLFAVANREACSLDHDGAAFCDVEILSPTGGSVASFNGMPVSAHGAMVGCIEPDIVIVPAVAGDLEPLLADRSILSWIRERHRRGACLATVCAGSFLLAESGLLEGRQATTHWRLASEFRERYPQVDLKPEKMIVDGGDYVCAGGVSAYLDLALYLVGRFGPPELAALCSKVMLVDSARRSQAPYRMAHFRKNHGDERILRAQEWLGANFAEMVSVQAMAQMAGLGERTFLRRFKKATGDSPLVYIQQLRIEAARRLLETTAVSVEEIVWQVGYEDASSFRRLFKGHTGLSPNVYRRRFSLI